MHHDMRIDICCYIYNSMLYKKLIIHCFQNTGFPAQLLSLNRTSILFLPPDGTSRARGGSPGLQEFDIKLIDTVDLEGGPGTQFAL